MKSIIVIVCIMVLGMGCAIYPAYPPTPESQGAGAGAILGGIAGGFIGGWRGAVIGGVLGAVAGATITDITVQAAREAVIYDHPVEYRSDNDRYIVRSEPEGYDQHTRCYKVHERIWDEGRLIKDQIKEVCKSTRYEDRY